MNTEAYNTIIGKTEDKLRKDNSFVRRNYIVHQIAKVIYIAASIASAFAIWTHLHLRAGETFGSAIAIIIASFLTLLIAGCQYMIKPFVDDWQAQAHIKGGEDGAMMFFKGLIAVIGIVAGVWLSLNGAAKAVDVVRKESVAENLPLVSIENIKREHSQRRAELQHQREGYETNTWEGKLLKDGLKGIKYIDGQISMIDSDERTAIAKADSTNTALLSEYYAETKINAAGAKGFMGFSEFLIILCAFMMGLFEKGTKNEAKSLGVKVSNPF